jgi:hypothetical protein
MIDPNVEQHLAALNAFKDWSNYLLVTTVAALGWVATTNKPTGAPRVWVLRLLAFSIVCGVLTLGLIPLVAESVKKDSSSIFDISVQFNLLWLWGPEVSSRLKFVCWPQHVSFLAGIIVYAIGSIRQG